MASEDILAQTPFGEIRVERDTADVTSLWDPSMRLRQIVTAERVFIDGELTPLSAEQASCILRDYMELEEEV